MKRYIWFFGTIAIVLGLVSQLSSDGGECASDFTTTSLPAPSSLDVGVILVQFSDWATNLDAKGGRALFFTGTDSLYTHQDFYRHLFSQDSYFTPNPLDPNSTPRTHDEEAIFGSMRDFFDENSFGKFTLTGQNLNDTTAAGIPNWVTLSQTKDWWNAQSINPQRLLDSTLAVCNRDPNCNISTSGFDKMILIYAGIEAGGLGGLNPAASSNRFVYQVGEKTGLAYGRTSTVGTFYGIGTHAHEFGHLLGLPDLKSGTVRRRGLGEFALMAVGNKGFLNGVHDASDKGGFHAPSHMCGWSKLCLGWAVAEDLTEGNMTFPHFEEDDQVCVFFIDDNDPDDWEEGEYFIFENRRPTFTNGARTFDGDMQIPGNTGGLLIFHHNDTNFFNSLKLKVIEADNGTSVGTGVASSNFADFYPGSTNETVFSSTSSPNSNDVNGNATGLSLTNITNTNGVVSVDVDLPYRESDSDLATGQSSGRRIVRDGSGDYHVVFRRYDQGFYAKYASSGNWSPDKRLSDGSSGNDFPSITERSGTLYVAWQRDTGSSHNIHFHKSTDGGTTWSPSDRETVATGVGSSDPLPVIVSPSSNNLVIVYRSGNDLVSEHSTNNGDSWPTTKTISQSGNSLNSPSLALVKQVPWGSANTPALVFESSDGDIYYRFDSGSWTGETNLSSIVPGSDQTHLTPSISAQGAGSTSLHVAWHEQIGSVSSPYANSIIYRKSSAHNSWPSEYTRIYYQDQRRPSITALASNKVDIVYELKTVKKIYKQHWNGFSWSGPTYIAEGQHPSVSTNHSVAAKYVWTSKAGPPFTVELSSETLNKQAPVNPNVYSRSIAWLAPSGAFLDVRVHKFSVKTKSGAEERMDFQPVSLDGVDLTAVNAWEYLASAAQRLPFDADSLVIEFSVSGKGIERIGTSVAEGPRFGLEVKSTTSGEKDSLVGPAILASGDLSERHYRLAFGLNALKDAIKTSELSVVIELEGLSPKSETIASLGHIYDFRDQLDKYRLVQANDHLLDNAVPQNLRLFDNYPNPFNPETRITYQTAAVSRVSLKIYNLRGQEIRTLVDQIQPVGVHEVQWDSRDPFGRSVASGIYVYRLQTEEGTFVKKMTLLR